MKRECLIDICALYPEYDTIKALEMTSVGYFATQRIGMSVYYKTLPLRP